MDDVVYDLVREFWEHGSPQSRNFAFEAYQDPRFSRAVRIYQFLTSVRAELAGVWARGEEVVLVEPASSTTARLEISYHVEAMRRTAYLQPAEWEIVRSDPTFARLVGDPAALGDVPRALPKLRRATAERP